MEDSLERTQRDLLARLVNKPILRGFYLAGGTALNIQLHHRVSADLDFFSENPLNPDAIVDGLKGNNDVKSEGGDAGTLRLVIDNIPVSFFRYGYRLLEKIQNQNIPMASLKDIGLMKIMAILGRGMKKDFIDLYAICRTGITIPDLLALAVEKFPGVKLDGAAIQKSLVFFDDAVDEVPLLEKDIDWEQVKRFFRAEVRKYSGLF